MFKNAKGLLRLHCPSHCQDSSKEIVGTNPFYYKSSICKAAIWSGAITPMGGYIFI